MNELFIQGFGLVAAILGISAVQWKRRSTILFILLVANVFWVIHFSLLGAYSGSALNLAGMIVIAVFFIFDNRSTRPQWLVGACIVLMIMAGLLTWDGWVSLLPTLGMIAGTVAISQINEQRIRVLSIATSILWLGYNVIVLSYVGAVKEIITILSTLIALWRFRRQGLSEVTVQKNS